MDTTTDKRPAAGPAASNTAPAARPLAPAVGAEITGIDLSKGADAAAMAFVRDTLNKYSVIAHRDQALTEVIKGVRGADRVTEGGSRVIRGAAMVSLTTYATGFVLRKISTVTPCG